MAAPAVVQSVGGAVSASGTTVSATWPAATTLHNRLLAILAINDNGQTVTPTAPAGYTLINPPGKVTRQALGADAVSILVYQVRDAAVQSGAKSFTLDHASFAGMALIEVSGDDNAVIIDGAAGSATGSAQTLLTGTAGPSTVAEALALACICSGNVDAHSNLLPAAFSQLVQVGSPTPAGTSKMRLSVHAAALSATGSPSASVDVAGGFNHNYAGAIIIIPSSTSAAPPPPSGDFDDGKAHLACTLDYFGTIDLLAHAQALADKPVEFIVGWMLIGKTNNYSTFADDMIARALTHGRTLNLLGYMKSAVRNNVDPANLPEAYFAHTCQGARIPSGSAGLDTMQPDGAATYADARGFTSHTFGEWKAHDCSEVVDAFNGTYADCAAGVMLDSLFTASYKGTNCNKALGQPYTKSQWVTLLRTKIAKAAVDLRPDLLIFANGLQGGNAYWATTLPSSGLLDYVHGGIGEGWLRANFDKWGTWPTLAEWKNCVNMLIDASGTRDKYVWTITNIENETPGNAPAGWVQYTAAQVAQWFRFAYCSHLLGQRGKALFEFVDKNTVKPWNETHPYYSLDLGAPLNQPANADAMQVGSTDLHVRSYTSGVVLANPSAAPLPFVADRDYNDPLTGADHLTTTTVTVPAHDGLILTSAAAPPPANLHAPAIVILGPPAELQLPAEKAVCSCTVTDADGDGIASVTMTLDGGAAVTPALVAGVYTYDFGIIVVGDHLITISATDNNGSPRTGTAQVGFTVIDGPSQGGGGGGGSGSGSGTPITVSSDVQDIVDRLHQRGV